MPGEASIYRADQRWDGTRSMTERTCHAGSLVLPDIESMPYVRVLARATRLSGGFRVAAFGLAAFGLAAFDGMRHEFVSAPSMSWEVLNDAASRYCVACEWGRAVLPWTQADGDRRGFQLIPSPDHARRARGDGRRRASSRHLSG